VIGDGSEQQLQPLMSLRVAPPIGNSDAEEDPENVKLPQALEMAFAFKSERARVLGRQDGDVPEEELNADQDEFMGDDEGASLSLSAKEKQRQKNKNKKKKKKKKLRGQEQSKENEENGNAEEKDKDEVNVEVE